MGFLRWIKRELDSPNKCKRRQSEPPLSGNAFRRSGDLPRDEAYIRALSKFNEWRNRQKLGSSKKVNKTKNKRNSDKNDKNIVNFNISATDCVTSTNLRESETIEQNNLYEEIRPGLRNEDSVIQLRTPPPKRQWNSECYSLKIDKHKNKLKHSKAIYENEIVRFENEHCLDERNLECNNKILTSPPIKFYHENSNPFVNVQSPGKLPSIASPVYATPDRKKKLWKTKSANSLCTKKNVFDKHQGRFEEHRKYKNKSAIVTPDLNDLTCINNSSQPYQKIVNKHGDEVEYALPLNELCENSRGEQISDLIEDNFRFLGGKQSDDSLVSPPKRGNIVTDLDKSGGTFLESHMDDHLFDELNILEMWSKNIPLRQKGDLFYSDSNSLIVCNDKFILQEDPSFRNGFKTPTVLQKGEFRKMPVTIQTANHCEKHVSERSLQQNLNVMRKLRHPHLALLMAVRKNSENLLTALILEPFQGSLNHLIHEEKVEFSIEDCLHYGIQMCEAAIYMHENGFVHSNISSQSILVSRYNKLIKLSSFELTTLLRVKENCDIMYFEEKAKYGITDENRMQVLHTDTLPNLIEYRKLFSQHFYQSPELLTTKQEFVFPTRPSDVYGIALTIWEMLNQCIPYGLFSYADLEKFFSLKQSHLLNFEEKRCQIFCKVLKSGLQFDLGQRVKKVETLKTSLEVLKEQVINDGKITETVPRVLENQHLKNVGPLSPKRFGLFSAEKTSTVKKRKERKRHNFKTAKELFEAKGDSKRHFSPQNENISPDVNKASKGEGSSKKEYQFDVGEIFVPNTPIARSNKLRRTAWLANATLSPIEPVEVNSQNQSIHLSNINTEVNVKNSRKLNISNIQSPLNKKINVNIRIIHGNSKNEESLTSIPSTSNISSQIKFWNSFTSPVSLNDNITKDADKSSVQPQPQTLNERIVTDISANLNSILENSLSKEQSRRCFTTRNTSTDPQNVAEESTQKNEEKSPKLENKDKSFEDTLWKRERAICEKAITKDVEEDGVIIPRRGSVKDTVNKFEKFSSSLSKNVASKSDNICSEIEIIRNKTLPCSIAFNKYTDHSHVENLTDNISNNVGEMNLSKLNVTLQSKSHKFDKTLNLQNNFSPIDKSIKHKKPMLLTVNLRKLDRRASDIGCLLRSAERKITNDTSIRHSIGGGEAVKSLGKITFFTTSKIDQSSKMYHINEPCERTTNLDDSITTKVGKLTCWNCGSALFVVNNQKKYENDACRLNNSNLLNTTDDGTSNILDPKNTEDIYIDDDFCQGLNLAANMELGLGADIFDLMNFDILPAGIFSCDQSGALNSSQE